MTLAFANSDMEASCVTPTMSAEIRRHAQPPHDTIIELERPQITLILPVQASSPGAGQFRGNASPEPLRNFGNMIFCPANMPLFVRPANLVAVDGAPGMAQVLQCAFDPSLFARITRMQDWDAATLRRCIDLRSAPLLSAMHRIVGEVRSARFGTEIMVESLGNILLVELTRILHGGPAPARTPAGLAPWQLRRIRDMLMNADGIWPSVASLASACGISRFHLSRCFMLATDMTLLLYSATIRIMRARSMLASGDRPIGEIAAALGFASQSSFTTAFKREMGVTPSDYARSRPSL